MASPILEAFVKLWADDSHLRASFQALAPHAQLAGTTVGDRFAAGMRKAAEQAHAAFRKDFIGPLQSEAFGTGIGRGMEPRPAEQFRASDLAVHKGMAGAVRDQAKALGASGEKAEAWSLSVREATQSARLFAGTIVGAVNPQLGAMVQVGGEAIRALKGMGVAIAGVGSGVAIGVVALGFYIERVKQAVDAKARLDAAVFAKDPAAASAEVAKRTAELDDLISKKAQAAQRTGARAWFGLGARERSFQEAIAFWSVIGKDVETSRKDLAESQGKTDALTRAVTFPQIDAKAGIEASRLLIQQIGLQRQSAETVEQLADSTQRLRAAKLELVEATIKEMDVTERVKAQNLFDAAAKRGAPVALDVQAKILDDITRRQANLRAAARAVDAEDQRQANRDMVAIEERQQAHAVRMGRVTMQAQLDFERAAMADPRRSLKDQEDAETKVFQTRRSMAEEYFRLQGNLGQTMWKEQLDVARNFLAETVEGSKAWFDQTQKIFDLYKGMREEARGIISTSAGLAESEASRQLTTELAALEAERQKAQSPEGKAALQQAAGGAASEVERRNALDLSMREKAARENAGISLDDIPRFLQQVRERDARALGGARVPIGDLSAAIGRVDFFRQADKLSPREAFSRLMEDPSKHLAREIGDLSGGFAEVTPVLTRMAEAGERVIETFLRIAGASPSNGDGTQPGRGERQRGGPPLSEENRQAIMDAIATRMTDEQLAVYGRR